ncbi:MAG: DEAD/DEAH box helicase [Rikenellaceae bacterium]
MNIVEPQPIQKIVIPVALRNQSVLVTSQTGSGKTLSYLLPLFQLLTHTNSAGVKALILAPTRELAQQIGGVCGLLCEAIPIKYSVIVGGVDYKSQREELSAHPDVVVATPGRLLDLMEQGVVSLSDLRFFVLDEVDQMLDLGFRESIIALSQSRAESAATLCFSATLPDDVEDMVALLEPSIERLTVGGQSMSVESVDHLGYFVSFEMMDSLLLHLLKTEAAEQSIIFTRSRKMADRVVAVLSSNAIAAEAMHSDRSQAAREHTLARFRSGETTIIVATDVMARGIDIESVTHVFNFGLPQSPEQYIHRCGRCGRAGRSGRAISIFTPEERPILDSICKLMKRHIVLDHAHPYMTPDVSRALNGTQRGAKRKKR